MQKQILMVMMVLLLTPIANFAQENTSTLPLDPKTNLITFTEVKEVGNTTSMELYQRALAWASTFYKNPTDVIRERDSVNGSILCKARFKISNPADKKTPVTDAGNVMYTLKLQFKEGRYRYELTEINWKQQSYFASERWMDKTSSSYQPNFESYLQQTQTEVNRILSSLEKAMTTAPSAKTDDW
ncbi:MAG: DUF4468 domain-containing protein [Bacteroidia bacterium]|jgi:hypothetical protein|nr:DUF4468 domain-containing protein [Bacteroidia bacterium]MBP7245571.1 DUF4468 domain-containing protein [Bacteroidia bacterium]